MQLLGAQENMNYILYSWENSAHEIVSAPTLEYLEALKKKANPKELGFEE